MTEAQLERQILDGLRARGWFPWVTHDAKHHPAAIGVPDIMAMKDGEFLAVECKIGKAMPTIEQQCFIGQLRAAGATAIVAHSWDDVERHIR